MTFAITCFQDAVSHGFDTVIDVRAPAEFAEDHIPGAINLPVLDDAQRAEVGTLYKQVSPFTARKTGAALVARNAADHIDGPLSEFDGGWRPLLYCWRGGQRSNAFASILDQIGWRVSVIEGGYRSYRRSVSALLYDQPITTPIILLDGNTGSAKTDLLHRVAARGGQVIDLEGLANHRGSVFGAMGMQPPQKWFETKLAQAISRLDPARPVLIEAESSKVGARVVPPALWTAMCAAPRIQLAVAAPARADYLVSAYDDIIADQSRLQDVIAALTPHQGAARIATWQGMARAKEFRDLAEQLIIHHYDPRYGRHGAETATLGQVALSRLHPADLDRAADQILALMEPG
ncbi:tRNA 2-selenouridine(34) synthase MnmH [Oceaniglobus ichthyenteri]|uniref:tRNA 2-selenouridine(34) synthase MnmH n=1 Tax=Oceaniglobus ichthyenteri TaxID=2136177 RepID=UPI000D3C1C37|nr:tRNA 2-selenouridine(34) synthase MnmH [Oceaniglobus ichthyenteri]